MKTRILPCLLLLLSAWTMALTAHAAAQAPDFSLQTDDGSISLSDYRDHVVLLDFWASWCGPCRASFPWMNRLRKRYDEGELAIIAVNLDKEKTAAKEFLKQYPADFTVAYDPQGRVAATYDLLGMPMTYLIGPDGRIRGQHIGFEQGKTADYEAELEALLENSASR